MKKKFSPSQILFHWVVFILIVLAYATMELKGIAPKGSSAREWIKTLHYTFGLSVMLLMLLRIILKVMHKDPEITPTPPHWQIALSKAVHGILYLMFISLPLLGVLSLYYGKVEWSFFSYAMPVSNDQSSDMQHTLKDIHEFIANTGYFIIGLHAFAAIFHHYIMRDNTLIRMIPWKK
ncbi:MULTISPECIES: cytochrome b561 [Serratia]|jgi:cytochrome b561|uniref:cytochrome b561 n=1 Tax=Serratia TaxID=613 RepID=UPI0027F2DE31|nr:cytochrome b561 [Serratia fonticola]MDQ7211838.1 cytochrome b561 [Serratia fonticola]HBE9081949.1 cytochrome b561 [Serratia fonticola]HBE9092512.1 cytochrome b561 [Serratia fonticola]HBE9154794.1 cytochrome b561 [Serratia fonticola]